MSAKGHRGKQARRGKRGPAPTPTEVLRRRGSPLIRKRAADGPLLRPVAGGPAPSLPRTNRTWITLLKSLPGFDPFRDAGNCWFDREEAERPIAFFHTQLRHFKGEKAGRLFYLERWQMAVLANLFGWRRPDGLRRFRYCMIVAGRKNGKSPFAAGLVLYLAFEGTEPGAEIYSAGLDYKQACKVWEYAHGMLVQNAGLVARCRIYNGQSKCLQLPAGTGFTFYRPIAGKPEEGYSFNSSAIVIDELFTQRDRRLVESLETSLAGRREPLCIYITTADFDRDSICNEKHDYARAIRDGGGDPYWLPALFEADDADGQSPERILDPKVWRKANPNLGVSVKREYIETEAKRAAKDPAYRAVFNRVHLCIRTSASSPAIPAEDWKTCGKRIVDPEALIGRPCWGGLDLAATTHSNAFALIFPEKDGYLALSWFWLPQATIEAWEERGKARYRVWAEKGLLTSIPGNTTDYAFIRRDVAALARKYRIREIAVDRLFQGAQLCTDLQNDGFKIIAFGQGFLSMAGPTKEFRELVLRHRFWHGDNPVLNWHAGNTSVAVDAAGSMKPNREKLHAPIDGIVSCIMAVGRAGLEPHSAEPPRIRAF